MKNSQTPLPKFNLLERLRLIKLGLFNWNIQTHLTSKELFKLYDLTHSNKNIKKVVEIGSYLGASSFFISKGLNGDGTIYCVDTWQNDAMSEGKWDTYNSFLHNTKNVSHKIKILRGPSNEIAIQFNEKIDMLFLDADHSYEAVKSDFINWFPLLKSGGLLLLHDIGWASGVQKLFAEDVRHHLEEVDRLPNLIWGWKK